MRRNNTLPGHASGTLIALIIVILVSGFGKPAAAESAIAKENRKTGTTSWKLRRTSDDKSSQIKGFASKLSVDPGESIAFRVSVNPSQSYSITIYRMGYYQGKGGRQVWQRENIRGRRLPACPTNPSTGQITCSWRSDVQLRIPRDWVTGIYLAKFTNAKGYENHYPFLVRNGNRRTTFLYQQPVTTYHAYNNYPNDGRTGKSTYHHNSFGANTLTGQRRAVKVSFDRPYADSGSYQYFLREHELVMFLEEHGYDVSYASNVDIHRDGSYFNGIKAFISAGHDEYWTSKIRDRVDAAKAAGIHLAFFGADAAYRQIRFEPDRRGTADRTMVAYKDYSLDPVRDRSQKTVLFRTLGRPEQSLIGIQYVTYGGANRRRDFFTRNTNHWIYANTGARDGDRIRGIVAGEVDNLYPNYPKPRNRSYTTIGESPFRGDEFPEEVLSQAVVYQALSGAWVFGSGTLVWHRGLNDPMFKSPVIRRMTNNLLDRFAANGNQATTPQLTISDIVVSESDGQVRITASLSPPATRQVSFEFSTINDGTARQGSDFYGAYARIQIPTGQRSVSLPVTIVDDRDREPAETFKVQIFKSAGAIIGRRFATVTIRASD